MTTPNYDPALENEREQRLGMLDAMSQAGTQGKKAFLAARQQIEAAKQAAIAAATARAAAIGAPAGAGGEAGIGGAYDTRLSNLADAEAGHAAYLEKATKSNEGYMAKLAAAIPVHKAYQDAQYQKSKGELEGEIARRRSDVEHALAIAKQRYEERQRAAEADAAWEAESRAHTRAGWAKEAAEKPLSDSELRVRLLGAGRGAKANAEANTSKPVPFADFKPGMDVNAHLANLEALAQGRRDANANVAKTPEQLAREIGLAANIDPNRVYGLVNVTQPTPPPDVKAIMGYAKTDEKTARTILDSQRYREARDQAYSFMNYPTSDGVIDDATDYDGQSPWEAYLTWLRATLGTKYTRTFDALVAEMSTKFGAQGIR